MNDLPEPLVDLARRQFAVLARRQLLGHLTPGAVDGHVTRGNLSKLQRGVYRATELAELPEQAAIAAALRCGAGAVITGPFALALLRLEGFAPTDPFEILVPAGRRLTVDGFAWRHDPFPRRPVSRRGEVRIAAPVDALLESCLWRDQLEVRRLRLAYDLLRWHHGLTLAKLRRRLAARGDADPAVIAFLEVMDGRLVEESEGERELAPFLLRLDPQPEPQVWITPRTRLDWYLRLLRIAWDYLGDVDHAYADRRRADAERDADLAARGIQVHYVTKADLEVPQAFLAGLMTTLLHRAEELGLDVPVLRAAS